MNTSDRKYSHPKRKFHDAWAFILFIIVTISCNAFYITQKSSEKLVKFEASSLTYMTISYVLAWMFLQTLLFLCMPALLMHVSFFLSPAISIGIAIYFQDSVAICTSFLFSAIGLFFYFMYYKQHIKYSAAVLRSSSNSIVRYSYVVIPTVLIAAFTLVAQSLFMAYNTGPDIEKQYLLYVVLVFQTFWLAFTMIYFGRVFVSSIVTLDLITVEEGVSIVGEAFKNSLYCLGSICLGSLIIAAITTLRFFHDKSRRENRDAGLVYQLFQAIIGIFLSLLNEFVEFANHWALIYMSLYGTKYSESVKESFNLVMFQRNYILVNNLCIVPVMNVLSTSMLLGYLALFYYSVKDGVISQNVVITALLTAFVMFLFNDIYISMFDTASKSFLFAYHKDPVSVKNKYPETYHMLEEQRGK